MPTPNARAITIRSRCPRSASTCSQRLSRASASDAKVVNVSRRGRSSTSVLRKLRPLPISRKGKAKMLKSRRNGNVTTRQSPLSNLVIVFRIVLRRYHGRRFRCGSSTYSRAGGRFGAWIDRIAEVLFDLHDFHVGLPHQVAGQISKFGRGLLKHLPAI